MAGVARLISLSERTRFWRECECHTRTQCVFANISSRKIYRLYRKKEKKRKKKRNAWAGLITLTALCNILANCRKKSCVAAERKIVFSSSLFSKTNYLITYSIKGKDKAVC